MNKNENNTHGSKETKTLSLSQPMPVDIGETMGRHTHQKGNFFLLQLIPGLRVLLMDIVYVLLMEGRPVGCLTCIMVVSAGIEPVREGTSGN